MIDFSVYRIQDIDLSSHALERAKQRIKLPIDANSFEFQIKIKELVKTTRILSVENDHITGSFVFDQKVFKVIAIAQYNNKLLIKTIIGD